MNFFKYFLYFFCILLLASCATYEAQFSDEKKIISSEKKSKISHTLYLIGDAGNSALNSISPALQYLNKHISEADKNSTLLFLGDNVYETGIPKKGTKNYALAKHRIQAQTSIAKKFAGKSIFIPGNHDWYNGLEGLKREEKLVEKVLGKKSFLPQNGCPLDKVTISKDIVLILVDTHWYLTNWDNHPTINDNCEIKTRAKFFDEFEGLIKKNRGKTTIVAMHHPMYTNGSHGGKYSLASHMNPLPVLGSIKNIIRKSSGISNTDLQNKKYNKLKKHIVTICQENDKTIFVSGHEHSLQYILKDHIPQIISGSGSKTTPTKLTGAAKFTYATQGFAKLDIYKDGSSQVRFYSVNDQKMVFQTAVLPANKKNTFTTFPKNSLTEKKASIYTKEEVDKSGFHRFLWGERYRKYYGTAVNAPTVDLDTLFGGLRPVRKGGGHQSKSLRLRDKKGREYVMRALRKNAVQFLQAVAFKDQYIEGQFDNTATENLLNDAFTGSHPYAPFTIGKLSDAIGLYHTNPILYFIPKQNSLGHFNAEFGDELYMIEERAASGHGDKASFGFANKVISTDDLLKNLSKNENHVLDEKAYIKARLFDMLIGDWDRHEDQWRWAVFKKGKQTIYRPIPRDRDQAFSIMGDGFLLKFATSSVPALGLMKAYDEDLKKPEWFNLEPYPLDMSLITQASKSDWDAQVKLISTNITDAIIEDAFTSFPEEVKSETINDIKRKLKGRRKNLQKISDAYYKYMIKYQIIKGTQKDDWFDIVRLPNGQTKVTAYRIKNGKKKGVFHQRTYKKAETKEIWIYGLDDDDTFVVKGVGKNLIQIRIIGGQNNDTYNIINGKKIKIFDHKSKKNTFTTQNGKVKLTDYYEANVYNYKKLPINLNIINPSVGFNPDDGIKLGLSNIFTIKKFERNPFSSQHIISGSYYFATNGFELDYSSEFANIFAQWNFGIKASFTSPNFAINYFGIGNNTSNPQANNTKGFNYNRVRIKKLIAGSFIHWKGDLDAKIKIGINFQNYQVENTPGRFINTQFAPNDAIFNNQNFLNTEASYQFENTDNPTFTTIGMKTELKVGYTTNLNNANNFGYIIPSISFTHKISSNGKLVFATKLKSHFTFGDGYEFYQAASIGGNREGLRGYRDERFTDKNMFYHSSDIRFNIRQVKTSLIPLNIGVYGGFDYGRVWGNQNLTINPFNQNYWNISYGGGVFFNAADIIGANLAAFHSDDGMRIAFGLGFNF